MATEIERKFLVDHDKLPHMGRGSLATYEQFYLARDPWVRVRLIDHHDEKPPTARLTIKGPGNLSRAEFEYEIPIEDAEAFYVFTNRPKRGDSRPPLLFTSCYAPG